VVVQEFRWDKGGTVRVGDFNFLYGTGNENRQLEAGTEYYQQLIGWSLSAIGYHI